MYPSTDVELSYDSSAFGSTGFLDESRLTIVEVTYAPEDPDVRSILQALHYKPKLSNSEETDLERRLNNDFFGLQLPGPAKVIQIKAGAEESMKVRATVSWDVNTQFIAFHDTDSRRLNELGIKSISLADLQSDDSNTSTQVTTLRDYYRGVRSFPITVPGEEASANQMKLSTLFPPIVSHVEEPPTAIDVTLLSKDPSSSFLESPVGLERYATTTPLQSRSTSPITGSSQIWDSPSEGNLLIWSSGGKHYELESRLRAEFEIVLKARLAEVQREFEAQVKESETTTQGYKERMAELQTEHNKETQRLRERLMCAESRASKDKKAHHRAAKKTNNVHIEDDITIPRDIAEMPLHGINGLQVQLFAARIELELRKRKITELQKKITQCECCLMKDQIVKLISLENQTLEMRMEMLRNKLQWSMHKILVLENRELFSRWCNLAHEAGDEEKMALYQEDPDDSDEETIQIIT